MHPGYSRKNGIVSMAKGNKRSLWNVPRTRFLHYLLISKSTSPGNLFDIKSTLDETWGNPRLAAHMLQSHSEFAASIRNSADTSGRRKSRRGLIVDPTKVHHEITALQKTFDSVQLKCW